jgi:nucleotide-binding universal stress UspA family protein
MTDSSREERTVVVGVDGSVGSVAALQWAVDHAGHLGRVKPVMAFLSGPLERGFGTTGGSDGSGEPYRSGAALRLEEFLQEYAPSLADDGEVIEHRAGPCLVKAAAGSELLVVGTRGWSSRLDLSVGSVGAYCARHTTVPIALIPPERRPVREQLRVAVGFDGSLRAQDALRWTLTHLRRSAEVVAVRAFISETVVGDPLSPPPAVSESRVRQELQDGVAAVLSDLDVHPAVKLRVVPGDPRAALRTASDDADLLVVGSRGHGVLENLLLGSVSTALVHHPTVPTIVVPHREKSARGRQGQ